MPPASRIRPYKDFLTPALHRRFASAAASLLLFCYLLAILIGQWDSLLWSWFPFSLVGIRMGLLFICAFTIFVLRVAQLHVGIRTTNSPFQTFRQYLLRYQTTQTAAWYLFSAWLFSEVYIFSAPSSADLRWIVGGNNQERLKLNERPIYLLCYTLMLALLQTVCHLYYDYDRIDFSFKEIRLDTPSDKPSHMTIPPSEQLRMVFSKLISTAFQHAFSMALIAPPIYYFNVRNFAWNWSLYIAKIFWNFPRSNALPNISSAYVMLIGRTFMAGFILTIMWGFSNAVFSAYVAEEPLKKGRPITHESRDPNGSLLTGLRGKKLQTRAFAFWELVCIAERFEGRRKAIFEDIDRKGGSTWSQVLEICLGVTDGINSRITEYLMPQPLPQPVEEPGLPRITGPLKEEDILSPVPKRNVTGTALANFVSSTIKAQSNPGDRHRIFKIAEKPKIQAPAPGNGKPSSPGRVSETIHPLLLGVLQSPLGWPFRQTFRRRINAIVLGSPYGYEGLIMDAVNAIARLAVFSLKEDQYGNVQRDIARIIRTFTSTISALEDFKGRLDMHWTDVEHRRECPEVDTLLAALKNRLRDILDAFSIYAEELHLTQRELRSAREAVAPSTQPAGDAKGPVGTLTEKEGQKTRQTKSSRFKEPAVEMRERPRERGLPRAASPLALTSGDGDDAQGGSNSGRRRSHSASSARDTGEIR